jgi:putative ABC transport system permease protein
MRPLSRLVGLWNTLFRKNALDHELDEEIRSAVDLLADRYVAQGMGPDDAKRAAEAEFGGVAGIAQTKGDVRTSRIGSGIDALLMDVRFAWRGVRRAPGLTAVAVVTLALGIGANTAIFSVVRAMLIQPLPYRDANRLTFIWLGASRAGPVSGPDFRELRTTNTTFADLAGIWASGTIALTGDAEPEALRASFVTTNFFQLLGVDAAYGRTFRAEDSAPGAPSTILLAWDLFQRRYGGNPSIVGRTIMVSDAPTIVIGVMPKTFRLLLPSDSGVPDHLQAWQPLWPQFEQGPRGNQFLRIVGRMKPGVTVAQARADVDAIARRIVGRQGVDVAFTTVGLQADDVREIRGPLLALFAGVGLLLLIACVNVGSLLVARAVSRSTEIAVRLTLGASHGRLLTQSLVEGSFLVAMGAMAGIAVGFAGLRLLPLVAPESLNRINVSRVDVTVLMYTVGISIVWGLLFSLAPMSEVLRLSQTPRIGLGGAGTAHSSTRLRYRTRAALVVAQVALSVVLLIGAGLLARAFVTVLNVDRGFKADNRLTFRVALNGNRYPTTEQVLNADTAFRQRLAAIPGVTAVGALSNLPYDDLPNWGVTYALNASQAQGGIPRATTRAISAGLFETLGVQLIEGRFFTDHEVPHTPVVIVDDMMANQLWPGRSAVGQFLNIGQAAPTGRALVVGVVRHLQLRSFIDDVRPQIFISYRTWQRSPMAYVLRSDRKPADLLTNVRAAVASVDPLQPIYDVRLLDAYVEDARAVLRFTMRLAAAFAVCALLLTSIGVYGVLSFAVASRRREFGVRRALGATTRRVMQDVAGEGLRLTLGGCALGVAGALVAGRLLQSQLYVVRPNDPIVYTASLILIVLGAVVACWVPGRRATTISPMDALRGN